MEQTLARFVHALRNADVVVTPAETLDAMAVLEHIDIGSRRLLKNALALTLAKSVSDKIRFDACFEQFFDQFAFSEPPKPTLLRSFEHQALLTHAEQHLDDAAMQTTQMVLNEDRTALALRVQENPP